MIKKHKLNNKLVSFSIIIGTRNRCASLKRTLLSIEMIDYPKNNYEIIIVDNNSTDETKHIVHEAEKKTKNISYYYEKNSGISFARNLGAKKSKFRYLIFIDDDIQVKPSILQGYSELWNKYPDATIIGGKIISKKLDNKTLNKDEKELLRNYGWCFANLNCGDANFDLDIGSTLYSANISYQKNDREEDLFCTKLGKRINRLFFLGAEDFELCTRKMMEGKRVIYSGNNKIMVLHFVHQDRFDQRYIDDRHRQSAIEIIAMEKILKNQFPHFKSFYLKNNIINKSSFIKLITKKSKRIEFFSYLTNRHNKSFNLLLDTITNVEIDD